jgi:hypothetical protein
MNFMPHQLSPHLSTTLKPCHPERSLAEREANRQTQSKDLARADGSPGPAGNFRIVVRFFDEREAELRPVSSREAAKYESPARKCRLSEGRGTSPAGTPPWHESVRIPQ